MAKELIFAERFKENFNRLPLNIQKQFDKQFNFFLKKPFTSVISAHTVLFPKEKCNKQDGTAIFL